MTIKTQLVCTVLVCCEPHWISVFPTLFLSVLTHPFLMFFPSKSLYKKNPLIFIFMVSSNHMLSHGICANCWEFRFCGALMILHYWVFWVGLLMILYLFLKFWLDRLLLPCFIQYILAMVVGRRCLLKLNFENTSHKSCRFTWHPSHVETDWLPLPNILLLQPLSFTIFSACYS